MNGKRMLIGILLITIFLINIVIPASAYVYNECYWYSGVATVKKATSIPTGWNTSLVAASTTWNNAGTDFRFSWSGVSRNYLYYASLGSSGPIAKTYPDNDGDRMDACYVKFNSDYVGQPQVNQVSMMCKMLLLMNLDIG